MRTSLVLILISVSLGVAGQLCLKAGMDQVGTLSLGGLSSIFSTVVRVITTPLVFLGLACYGVSAAFWLVVLTRLDLSLAYPMLALTYVLIPLAAHFILGEDVPALRWVGIAIVVVGIAVVAQT